MACGRPAKMSPNRTAACSNSRSRPRRPASHSAVLLLTALPLSDALHHMKRTPSILEPRVDKIPLQIVNQCKESIYPGIASQHGISPEASGFRLDPGTERTLNVSTDWQGRVWGRTNCTFNHDGTAPANGASGRACATGDCGGVVDCRLAGEDPVTLAEFTSNAGDGQSYYDISLVDGYNLPLAVIAILDCGAIKKDISPNNTNPSCVATSSELAEKDFNPYMGNNNQKPFLGTNLSSRLPFETSVSEEDCLRWCPWDLQVDPPKKPGHGVYPFPDDNIRRKQFQPCFSACAKYHEPRDCCTGKFNSPDKCKPSTYSRAAKKVCPDAYSFAYDDRDSTFVIPAGCGFKVVFCPGGRSTNILASNKGAVLKSSPPPGIYPREGNSGPDAQRPAYLSNSIAAGDIAGLTWWLMGAGLLLTASVFVLL